MLWNFGWVRDREVAGMGFPDPDAWGLLAREGIGAVLSLTRRRPPGDPAEAGLEALHVPIPDFGAPTPPDLRRCIRFLDEQVEAGRAVVVHCQAGLGRTGTILAAWLVHRGMTADEAIRHVRTLRPGSLETAEQVRCVRSFARGRLAARRRTRGAEGA